MKKFLFLALFCSLSLGVARADDPPAAGATAQPKLAPVADKAVQVIYDQMMTGLKENNYGDFVTYGNDDFKVALTPALFQSAVGLLAPRINNAYETTYFGTVKQKGADVYIWKLTFEDKGDDMLATMVLKDGKVAGFVIH